MLRIFSALNALPTFEERFDYLKLHASVGVDTFGFERYLNQKFYSSREWKAVREAVIVRDRGFDLGVPGRVIVGKIMVHHMNPMTRMQVVNEPETILNPDFLIAVSHPTHNAIHYGELTTLKPTVVFERQPNDTVPWKEG